MVPLIQSNAARLRELHDKVNETVKTRSKSQGDYETWQEACRQFHAQYDALAFPGGLTEGILKIKQGDIQTIEIALNYLEATPYCYRSQYVATDLKRAINKATLQEPQVSRYAEWKAKKARTKRSR